jgi:NTE family protein
LQVERVAKEVHMLSQTTLVMGAGGPWGVAWMTGLLLGLEESGLPAQRAVAMIGSSAGAILGSRLSSGIALQTLFDYESSMDQQRRQAERLHDLLPTRTEAASAVAPSSGASFQSIVSRTWDNEEARIRAVCDLAASADTVSWDSFDAVARPEPYRSAAWPATPFKITAIDLDSRSLVTFDASSGVDHSLAVVASCAIPGLFPPVPINGRRYIDGGSWGSGDNAHLALGAPAVLVISPLAAQRALRAGGSAILERDLQNLRASGARVHLVSADPASLATRGTGAPNPTLMVAAAKAGREQGRNESATLQRVFA